MKNIFEDHTKKGLVDLGGRNVVGTSCTKTRRPSLGKFRKKSFALPKICLLLHQWWKAASTPISLFEGQRRKWSRHAFIFRRACAYYYARTLFTRCRLQCFTAMNINSVQSSS